MRIGDEVAVYLRHTGGDVSPYVVDLYAVDGWEKCECGCDGSYPMLAHNTLGHGLGRTAGEAVDRALVSIQKEE